MASYKETYNTGEKKKKKENTNMKSQENGKQSQLVPKMEASSQNVPSGNCRKASYLCAQR